jgi:hypothetical protein
MALTENEAIDAAQELVAVLLEGPDRFDGRADLAAAFRALFKLWRGGLANTQNTPLPAFDRSIPVFEPDDAAVQSPTRVSPEEGAAPATHPGVCSPRPSPASRGAYTSGLYATDLYVNAPEPDDDDVDDFNTMEISLFDPPTPGGPGRIRGRGLEVPLGPSAYASGSYRDGEQALLAADLDDDMDEYARAEEEGWPYDDHDRDGADGDDDDRDEDDDFEDDDNFEDDGGEDFEDDDFQNE